MSRTPQLTRNTRHAAGANTGLRHGPGTCGHLLRTASPHGARTPSSNSTYPLLHKFDIVGLFALCSGGLLLLVGRRTQELIERRASSCSHRPS